MAVLLLLLTNASPAFAADGTFYFEDTHVTVDEGDTAGLLVSISGRSGGGTVYVGYHINATTAEAGDFDGQDGCVPVTGTASAVPIFISTFADADNADDEFTVTLTFDNNDLDGTNCANDGTDAAVGSPATATVTINDGVSGTGNFSFEATASTGEEGDTIFLDVLRQGDLGGSASVDCVVVGGSAESADYTIVFGTANFGNNDPTGTCRIDLKTDADSDVSETIIVELQNPSNGTVGSPDTHTITIVQTGAKIVQFDQSSYTIDEDAGTLSVIVRRFNLDDNGDTVVCRTVELPGEADEDIDYLETDDVLVFDDNDTQKTCTVPIIDDNFSEGDETFLLHLDVGPGDALPGADALVTINDDETNVTYQFSAANYNVSEGAGTVTITIVRSSSVGSGSVHWATSNGSAAAGADYLADAGTESFSPGELEETFLVTILQDTQVEGNQTINLTLSSPSNGSLGAQKTATITILDDEGAPTITGVSPSTVSTSGGTVVITGTNFTGATAVTVCGVNVTSYTVNSATQITATLPARSTGTCDIRVTNPVGQSANTAADNVVYQAATTTSYTLSFRWTLLAWLGKDGLQISSAVQGIESPDNTATNNVSAYVTAIATWDGPNQRYLFWFPGGASVPGANDITTLKYGSPYWVAVNSGVTWTILQGP